MTFRMKYFGIRVKDLDESIRFYTNIFGMTLVEAAAPTPATNGRVATLKSPGSEQVLELNWYEPGSKFGPRYKNGEDLDHIAFDCENLSSAIDELRGKGVEVVVMPKEIGERYGWNEAFVKDPNGIWVELIERK